MSTDYSSRNVTTAKALLKSIYPASAEQIEQHKRDGWKPLTVRVCGKGLAVVFYRPPMAIVVYKPELPVTVTVVSATRFEEAMKRGDKDGMRRELYADVRGAVVDAVGQYGWKGVELPSWTRRAS